MIEGELQAGHPFERPIGNGLKLWFQPIASGWILRIVPLAGSPGEHDYAELATPPYHSVSPLSISTDFAFRAQDAIGWNPRRFHYATSRVSFLRLEDVYQRFMNAGATPPPPLQLELSDQIASTAEGKLTILDSRLVPGTADQWRMAAAVSSHFENTAHRYENAEDGKPSALGQVRWLRFRVELDLPNAFVPAAANRLMPHPCGSL